MKRLEVIANQSIREELVDALEAAIPDIEYSLLPTVQGKGRRKRKIGTRTWPETNFLLLIYLEEEDAAKAEGAIREIVRAFPNEGLFAALSEAQLI